MQAKDIMSTRLVTVSAEATLSEIAQLMVKENVSGVPVLGHEARVVGMITEGDLLRRAETQTERHGGAWHRLFAGDRRRATEYLKSHARTARDVMTTPVIGVAEDTEIDEIAELLDTRGIKRVPILRDEKLVGIVSRRDFVALLAHGVEGEATRALDEMIRDRLLAELHQHSWAEVTDANIVVENGVVQLWGIVGSPEVRAAIRVAAENIPGVRHVCDYMREAVALI